MLGLLATVVDTRALLETVAAALIAGVGVALTFSLTILGAARFGELSRERRTLEAAFFALLGLVGLAATAGAIAFGIVVMTSK